MTDSPQIRMQPAALDEPAALLFVDDEANILSALKRLSRTLGYRIFKNFMLDAGLIAQIQNFGKTDGALLPVFIKPERR